MEVRRDLSYRVESLKPVPGKITDPGRRAAVDGQLAEVVL